MTDTVPCEHEFMKVCQYQWPKPDHWTCSKCGWAVSDADHTGYLVGQLHTKLDGQLNLLKQLIDAGRMWSYPQNLMPKPDEGESH